MINIKTLTEFKKAIKQTKTKEELQKISYEAFLADDNALNNKNTLYNKVISECIKHEIEMNNAKR